MSSNLRPSIQAIRSRLFPDPTAWGEFAENEDSRPSTTTAALASSEAFTLALEVQEIFANRAAIERSLSGLTPGRAGQIVCVESLICSDLGSGQAVLPVPVFVLLDAPARIPSESNAIPAKVQSVWRGWIVAPEVDYVGEWDVLLDDDELREDACQFIQTWNVVDVYLPCVQRVAGTVGDGLLTSIRYLSRCFAAGIDDATTPMESRPGEMVLRRLSSGLIRTGTYQDESDTSDMRNSYVSLYGAFADTFSESVRRMLAGTRELEEGHASSKPQAAPASVLDRTLALAREMMTRVRSEWIAISLVEPQGAWVTSSTASSRARAQSVDAVFEASWQQEEVAWTLIGERVNGRGRLRLEHRGSQAVAAEFLYWVDPASGKVEQYPIVGSSNIQLVEMPLLSARDRIKRMDSDRKAGRAGVPPFVQVKVT